MAADNWNALYNPQGTNVPGNTFIRLTNFVTLIIISKKFIFRFLDFTGFLSQTLPISKLELSISARNLINMDVVSLINMIIILIILI